MSSIQANSNDATVLPGEMSCNANVEKYERGISLQEYHSGPQTQDDIDTEKVKGDINTCKVALSESATAANPIAGPSITWAEGTRVPSEGKALRIPSPRDQDQGSSLCENMICISANAYCVGKRVEQVDIEDSDDGKWPIM
jgi:hypothetical protein